MKIRHAGRIRPRSAAIAVAIMAVATLATPPPSRAGVIDTVAGPNASFAEVSGSTCDFIAGNPFSGCGSQTQINLLTATATSITGTMHDIGGIPAGSIADFPLIKADLAGDLKMKGSARGGIQAQAGANAHDVITLTGDTSTDGTADGMFTVPISMRLTGTTASNAIVPADPLVPIEVIIDFGLSGVFAADHGFTSFASCGSAQERIATPGVFGTTVTIPDAGAAIDKTVSLTCTTPALLSISSFLSTVIEQSSLDFSGTATLSIDLPLGVFGTSDSGVFANFVTSSNGAPVPEPSTLSILGLGIAALCIIRRRRVGLALLRGTNLVRPG